ncbi:hypothetical protein [Sphingomonas alpina]|uniref:Uncharacterized protein n=1 Tax=Sphingomonas alpina TaxID=653931 RepID=A0A7H0LFD8_9SPHN|nr:hypothetical protein [Sphingomonas alpina]QNQ08391.1 hypothetical protein H3Z74_16770 [Sphingomonas alpina]
MRGAGVLALLLALWGLGYGWFALGWDAGTGRAFADHVLIGASVLLGILSSWIIVRRRSGKAVPVLAGVLAALVLFVLLFAQP